jgi:hypothetical protein
MIKKIIVIIVLTPFWFIIEAQNYQYCHEITQIVLENTFEDSDNITVDCFPAFMPDGKYLFYYSPDQQDSNQKCLRLAMVGYYQNGVPHGVWIGYYVNGNVHWIVSFNQGCFSGSYQIYYPNGSLMLQGTYCRHCIGETQSSDAILKNICRDGFQFDVNGKFDTILGRSMSWHSISNPPSLGYNLFYDSIGVLRSEKFFFDCYGNGWDKHTNTISTATSPSLSVMPEWTRSMTWSITTIMSDHATRLV